VAQPAPSQQAEPTSRRLGIEEILFLGLVALSIVGIAVTDFARERGLWYWLVMVPVFAGASITAGWSRARSDGQGTVLILRQQLLHWLALAAAVYLIYLFQRTGHVKYEDAGLVALVALALTTFLAGVHFDWRLGVLGAVLFVAAACAALIEHFFWVLLLPALLVAAVAVFWRRRGSKEADESRPG
jgi:hypothetical protein